MRTISTACAPTPKSARMPVQHGFFALSHSTIEIIGITLVGSAIAIAELAVTDDRFVPGRAQ